MKRTLILAAGVLLALAMAAPSRPAAAPDRPLDIYFVDVEGGAATLIVTPAGESVLIDSGWPREDARDAKRIEQAARYQAGLKQIDHYITTHWHTDHYGGIEALAKLMPVRNFWDRGIPPMAEDDSKDFPTLMAAYKRVTGGRSKTLHPGDKIPLTSGDPALELQCIAGQGKVIGEGKDELPQFCAKHPTAPVPDESDNMRSLAFHLKYGKFDFLNCGDLTWNIEHKLACPKNRVGQVDLWQVTHHGWEASSNPALVEAIEPRVAIVVNGPHKGASPRVMRLLKNTKSLEAVYQLHVNLDSTADDNTSRDRIANLEENCKGEYLHARVDPDAAHYTVSMGEKPGQRFTTR